MIGRILLALGILAVSLTGCAPLGRPEGPPDHLINAPHLSPRAGEPSATLTLYRDGSFTGSFNYRWIALDGQVVASLKPLQRVELRVAPGSHEVAVYCYAWLAWRETKLLIAVVNGQSVAYLLTPEIPNCAKAKDMTPIEAAEWQTTTTAVGTQGIPAVPNQGIEPTP